MYKISIYTYFFIEKLSNENFNLAEFSRIKNEAHKKTFTMTPSKWCVEVSAIGMTYIIEVNIV